LIAATGIKLMSALRSNVMGWRICALLAAATFVAIAWLRWPLAWVLLGLGGAGFAWAYRCMANTSSDDQTGRAP
jgi:chromate transporter